MTQKSEAMKDELTTKEHQDILKNKYALSMMKRITFRSYREIGYSQNDARIMLGAQKE
jgi:hypothetical protein